MVALKNESCVNPNIQEDIPILESNSRSFARENLAPPGAVNYSFIVDKYTTYRNVRHDIKYLSDFDFDERYHENREKTQRRLESWLLMDQPVWNASLLTQAFELNQKNLTSVAELSRNISNAQSSGMLNESFSPREGINWLRLQGEVPFNEFIGQFPPVEASKSQPSTKHFISTKQKHVWDTHSLARLADESRQPGQTHTTLAKQYDVSRQFISKLLKREKPKKANAFNPSNLKK